MQQFKVITMLIGNTPNNINLKIGSVFQINAVYFHLNTIIRLNPAFSVAKATLESLLS